MSNNSSGPKTPLGKKRSRQNARRHGLFAAAFSFSAADEVDFRKLNLGFHEVLKPTNAVLDVMFDYVLACAWRLRDAFRYEQQELPKQFAIEHGESPEELQGVGESFPYGLKARKTEQALKLLDELRTKVENRRVLPPEFEAPVTQVFGPNFWKRLTEWDPPDPVMILCSRSAEHAVEISKLFDREMPEEKVSPEEKKKYEKKYVTADGVKEKEMMCKIIDIYRDLLVTRSRPGESGGILPDERGSRLDLSIRYHTTARRDFYRSLMEYWETKNHG